MQIGKERQANKDEGTDTEHRDSSPAGNVPPRIYDQREKKYIGKQSGASYQSIFVIDQTDLKRKTEKERGLGKQET